MADITRRFTITSLAGASALAACTPAAAPEPLTVEAMTAWLDRYKAAWEARDAAAASTLFTEDASYHEMPFDPPMEGRTAIETYWARVTAPQSDIHFTYDLIAREGLNGTAHWNATFNAGGQAVELDGVFALNFNEDATQVSRLREWWHARATPAAPAPT